MDYIPILARFFGGAIAAALVATIIAALTKKPRVNFAIGGLLIGAAISYFNYVKNEKYPFDLVAQKIYAGCMDQIPSSIEQSNMNNLEIEQLLLDHCSCIADATNNNKIIRDEFEKLSNTIGDDTSTIEFQSIFFSSETFTSAFSPCFSEFIVASCMIDVENNDPLYNELLSLCRCAVRSESQRPGGVVALSQRLRLPEFDWVADLEQSGILYSCQQEAGIEIDM